MSDLQPSTSSGLVTSLLCQAADGSAAAMDDLLPLIYGEMRALAGHMLAGERRDHTLQPTALVHEAYARLVQGAQPSYESRRHFFAIAARAMRQVLADHARKHRADKRGGDAVRVTLNENITPVVSADSLDLIALDEAMEELTKLNERHARIVEMRFLAGLSVDDVADTLGVSSRTVETDWRTARAWLRTRLGEPGTTR